MAYLAGGKGGTCPGRHFQGGAKKAKVRRKTRENEERGKKREEKRGEKNIEILISRTTLEATGEKKLERARFRHYPKAAAAGRGAISALNCPLFKMLEGAQF